MADEFKEQRRWPATTTDVATAIFGLIGELPSLGQIALATQRINAG